MSADQMHAARVARFRAEYKQGCTCPLELREEGGRLVCATCDRPVVRRVTPTRPWESTSPPLRPVDTYDLTGTTEARW